MITGASSGIGEQLAYACAQHGANLMLSARREQKLQAVASQCRNLGAPEAFVVCADMSVQAGIAI